MIHEVEQGSEWWFMLRLGRITASNFKDMFSKPNTISFQKLINNCVFEKLTNEIPESFKSEWMQRGNDLEPLAFERYQQIKEFEDVKKGPFYSKGEFFGASPDGVVGDKGGLEIKCPSPHVFIDYLLSNKLPSVYKWQVHGQMNVCGFDWVDFFPFHPDLKSNPIRVYRDEKIDSELELKMKEVEEIILERIEKIKQYEEGE